MFVKHVLGKVDSRWGMLWSPFQSKLQQNLKVIETAIWLHNVIICHKMEIGNMTISSKGVDVEYDDLKLIVPNPNEITGIFGDQFNAENAGRGGSDNLKVRELKRQGKLVRDGVKTKLMTMGAQRSDLSWFMYDPGRVEMS